MSESAPTVQEGCAAAHGVEVTGVGEPAGPRVQPEPQGSQPLEGFAVRRRRRGEEALVDEDFERDSGGLAALHPAQRACREVAGIGVRFGHRRIDLGEPPERKEDLAAGCEGDVFREAQGHRTDGLHVGRDVVAHQPVAPRDRPGQDALFVVENDRGAVDLLLADEREPLPRAPGRLFDPRGDLGVRVGLVEAQHGQGVRHLGKLLCEVRSDPAAGRVGHGEIGVLGLETHQLVEEPVVLAVGNERPVEDVVSVLVFPEDPRELGDTLDRIGTRHGRSIVRREARECNA